LLERVDIRKHCSGKGSQNIESAASRVSCSLDKGLEAMPIPGAGGVMYVANFPDLTTRREKDGVSSPNIPTSGKGLTLERSANAISPRLRPGLPFRIQDLHLQPNLPVFDCLSCRCKAIVTILSFWFQCILL
jgi:hypothetical protein